MWSFVIVEREPSGQVPSPDVTGLVEANVGPLAQERLNEAFGLAVCLRTARASAKVTKSQGQTGVAEVVGAITIAVVGEQPLDRDAVSSEPGESTLKELHTGARTFVGQDFGIGD